MAKKSSAEFIQWIPHVLDSLRALGGTSTLREVADHIATKLQLPDTVRFARYPRTGNLKFPNQVAFARQYLYWDELVISPKTGVWALSPRGKATHLKPEDAQALVKKWVSIWSKRRAGEGIESKDENSEAAETAVAKAPMQSYQDEIRSYLRRVQSSEFERFCADLLKQLGMVRVSVLGGAGDKGIDGMGYLPSGPIVTTKVAFQCKRYNRPVTPSQVREFRGAIGHKAEKGIMFTTDVFTNQAIEAAGEDMNKPIELIDIERIVQLLESTQFGLKETKTYEVDWNVMDRYEIEPHKHNSK